MPKSLGQTKTVWLQGLVLWTALPICSPHSTLKPWGGPVEKRSLFCVFLPAFFRFSELFLHSPSYPFEGPWCSQEQSSGLPDLTWPHYCTSEEDDGHAKPCSVVTRVGQAPSGREECWELASLSSSWKGQKVDLRVLSWETLPPIQTPAGYLRMVGADPDLSLSI